MNQRLLITLGCSWTEGVGCYIPKVYYDTNNILSINQIDKQFKSLSHNRPNFHEFGWPNRVGKKLGFDKVVNLGSGGGSNSASLKMLQEYYEDANLENYDIFIIWMLTEPSRFSFYNDGRVKNYLPSLQGHSKLSDEYLKEIKNINLDTLLEQKFYMKSIEDFCVRYNIQLLFTSWHDTYPLLNKLYKTDKYLNKKPTIIRPPFTKLDNGFLKYYSFCSHPNQDGYNWMSDEIVRLIKKHHKNWYTSEKNIIEWEWLGDAIKNKDIFEPI